MTTSIEKDELATELQELYLKGKEWISDLDFQEDEIKFLKMLFGINCPLLVKHNEFEEISDTLIEAAKLEGNRLRLKKDICDFMNLLSRLIKTIDPNIDTNLIQWNSQLEADLKLNFDMVRAFKKHVFNLASEPA